MLESEEPSLAGDVRSTAAIQELDGPATGWEHLIATEDDGVIPVLEIAGAKQLFKGPGGLTWE